MRLNWRKTIRICGLAVGVVLCLSVGRLVFLHSGFARQAILDRIVREIRAQNVLMDVESLDYNLWRMEAKISRVQLRSAFKPDLPPVLRLESLSFKISPSSLLRQRLDVTSIDLVRPVVHVLVSLDGSTNLPHLPPSEGTSEPIDWIVRRLEMSGATIRFEDLRNQVELLLPQLDAKVTAANRDRHEIRLRSVQDGYVLYRGESVGINELDWTGIWEGDSLSLAPLRLVTDAMDTRITGKIHRLADPLLEVDLEAGFILERLSRFAGIPDLVRGRATAAAHLQGPLGALEVNSSWRGQGLDVGPVRNINWQGEIRHDPGLQRIYARNWQLAAPLGVARANGSVTMAGGNSNVSLDLDRVALDQVLALTGDLPVAPAALLTGRLEGRFPQLNWEQGDISGRLRLTPTQADTSERRVPVTAELSLRGNVRRMNTQVESMSALGLESTADLSLLGGEKLEGEFEILSSSLKGTLAAADRLSPEPGALPDFEGNLHVAGFLTGTIDAPLAAVELTGSNWQSGIVTRVNVVAKGMAGKDSFQLEDLTARWRGQRLHAAGEVNWTGPSPAFTLQANTEGLALERVLQGIGQASVPLQGNVELKLEAQGTLDHPQAIVDLAGSGLTASGEDLGLLTGQAKLDGDLLNLESLRLSRGFEMQGKANLKSQTYEFNASAPAWQLTGLTFPQLEAIRGNLELNATGNGVWTRPQAQTQIKLKNLEAAGLVLGDWTTGAELADQKLNFELSGDRFALKASGNAELDGTHRAVVHLQSSGTSLAAFPLPADLPLRGALDLKFQAEADWRVPLEAKASLELQPLDFIWNGQSVQFAEPLRAQLENGFLSLDPSRMEMAGSNLSIGGRMPVDPAHGEGNLAIGGEIDLAKAPLLVSGWTAGVEPKGFVDLDVSVSGSLAAIDPRGEIRLRDAAVVVNGFTWLDGLQGRIGLEEGSAQLHSLEGKVLGGRLDVKGAFPYSLLPEYLPVKLPRQSGSATMVASVTGMDPAQAPGAPENFSGLISARLDARALALDKDLLNARLVFDDLRFRLNDLVLQQTSPSVLEARQGSARIENMILGGPGTDINVRGRIGFEETLPLTARISGKLETGMLSTLAAPLRLSGPARLELSAYGPAATPQLAGFLEWTDGTLRLPEPRLAAENVQARINFTGDEANLIRFAGELNGGTVEASGSVRFPEGVIRDPDLRLEAKNVYLDFPEGLRTVSEAKIRLAPSGDRRFLLAGDVEVQEGLYREPVTIEGGLLQFMNQPAAEVPAERNEFLDQLGYAVNLRTSSPVVINNNLAKAGLEMDLRLTGDYYHPSLLDRITIEEGGQIFFAERSYTVERGVVTFTNEQKIEAGLDILARTRVAGHDISLNLSGGGANRLETTLTSDPPTSEPDILSMLITGKPVDDVRGNDPADMAGRQALSYFAGSFGSRFTRQLERSTGLSMVRVEPDLIANEANPSARLTVGQDFTNAARLIYSMNLTDGGDQIYIAEYDLTRRFTTRGIKQTDNTYRFEFRHDLRFGAPKPDTTGTEAAVKRILGEVKFPVSGPVPDEILRGRMKLRLGRPYDFFAVRRGVDRLESYLERHDYLEARVRLDRSQSEDGAVNLGVQVEAGAKLEFAYEGWSPSGKLRRKVRESWREGVFDLQRTEEAEAVIREELIEAGFPRATVTSEVREAEAETKLVTFTVEPGVKLGAIEIEFPGAEALSGKELESVIGRSKLENAVLLSPGKVRDRIAAHYRQLGYLDAKAGLPQVDESEQERFVVRVPITEGVKAKLAGIEIEGAKALEADVLKEQSRLSAGMDYVPQMRQDAVNRLRDYLLAEGYAAARVESAIERQNGDVQLRLRVEEGNKQVLAGLEVTGNRSTSEGLVAGQVAMKDGDTLTPRTLAESRRNLYSTGAYSLVDLERVPADVAAGGVQPILLKATVREVPPFDLRYGAYFDTDRGPGGVVDFTNRNSLGAARAIGGRLRYDNNFREARAFFSQPVLRRLPLQNILSTYVNRQLLPSFITDRAGFSAQQEYRFRRIYLLNYGYRIEQTRTYDRVPDEFFPFDVKLRVAPLTFTMNRETRDDFLDATRGSFVSHGLQYAPAGIGSDLRFVRYYGQFFKYIPLSKAAEIPLSGGMMRPRWVYASALRTGLARGLGGQELIRTERFFAGGGTTLRGFKQNTLGPQDFFGDPAGGNAVLLINQELRFPAFSIFDGVGFADLGNVFPTARDFSLTNLRRTAGVGVRIRTPYFLIRLDYGFKLDRRPGEAIGTFFFSIGQAF